MIDRLADRLPPGRLVTPEFASSPRLWVSDGFVVPGVWQHWRAEHARTGLWPLLLRDGSDSDQIGRPWLTGELMAADAAADDDLDAHEVLTTLWDDAMPLGSPGDLTVPEVAPYGRSFPGLAPDGVLRADPEALADDIAASAQPPVRLGLVLAASGAEAVRDSGWFGPVNAIDPVADLAVVLRSWQHRFGARVVELGFDTLTMSIAAPPSTLAQSLQVAAERFAICPDEIWQGEGSMRALAEQTMNATSWSFWWD